MIPSLKPSGHLGQRNGGGLRSARVKRAARKIPKVILKIESSRASGRALLHGIAEYSRQKGPWAFSWEAGGLSERWPQRQFSDADGIILRDITKLDTVLAVGVPVVVIGHLQREIAEVVNVSTDSPAIGRLGAEHLIQCGVRNFALCGFKAGDGAQWSETRGEMFSKCVAGAGFNAPAFFNFSINAWGEQRVEAIESLRSLPKPVGLMDCNDDCGQRVMELCKSAGVAVPDEVGVIGADNDEVICNLMDP